MKRLASLTSFAGWKATLIVPIIVVSIAAGAGVILAQDNGAPPNPPKEKAVAAGEVEAKRLLLLMDKDQNGKVSRQEFMDFMAAEFERLDKNKDGELDVKELTQLSVQPRYKPPRR